MVAAKTQDKIDANTIWIQVAKHKLYFKDELDIENIKMLNDRIIDTSQIIVKDQFTDHKIERFQSVLNKQRISNFKKTETEKIQTLHRGSTS